MSSRRIGSDFALDHVRHDWKEISSYLRPCKSYAKGKTKIRYLNISTAFDIETTSIFRNRETGEIREVKHFKGVNRNILRKKWEKIAFMYAWVFVYDGHAFTGRTWDEYKSLLDIIREYHGLSDKLIMITGVHNLAYEFQFFRTRFEWESVFAVKDRTPIYARTKDGIEYRCTLLLSGYSLAKVGEHLLRYPCKKMIGDLDYDLIRHSRTPLTDEEWGYIVNDGLIVSAYIQELIERMKRITWIPLTKTGFVRKHLKHECYFSKSDHKIDYDRKYASYRRIMESSTIGGAREYKLLKQGFTGAIVHCNSMYSNMLLHDVASQDETSAYPTQIAIGGFPFGRGKWVMPKNKEEFNYYLNKKVCYMEITFFDIERSQTFESLISKNKCIAHEGFIEDNGRLMSASMIRVVIDDVDYSVYRKFYKWSHIKIHKMIVYEKRRLPSAFVSAVLDLYAKKTELKGIEGMESEYMSAKENINATYGCCVTDICRAKNEYILGEWVLTPCDIEKELKRYNKSKSRFICYQWGCRVTSLARRALATAIYALGDDYIYSDTDSVKYRHPERHEAFFRKYNAWMMEELKKASEYHHIPLDRFMPKTKEGIVKPLGVWENETADYDGGVYKRFKSLGAKRYAVEYSIDGVIHHSLTIAGVNKRTAIPYIEKHEKDFFDFMRFGYVFTEDCCGKKLHTYIDEPKEGEVMDYLGKVGKFQENSSVHLMPTTYEMTTSDDYLNLLDMITTTYHIV